ncbi:MAG: hypothetical protein ACO3C6_08130 [Steroidobacteraceae bacterium]
MFTRTTMLGVTALCAVLVAGLGFAPEAEAGKKRKRAQQQSAAGYVAATPSLVDVAIAANTEGPYAGSFDILLAAVGAAEPVVATALSTRGQLTVFAPTATAIEARLAALNVTHVIDTVLLPGRAAAGSGAALVALDDPVAQADDAPRMGGDVILMGD